MIDLHLHTKASDGILSLEELVQEAETAGLTAIAVTDHDTVQSARRIKDLKTAIEVIPGMELSVYDNKLGYIDLHVLGLFIDPEDPKLLSTLERLEKERDGQKRAIIGKLNEMGYEITYEEAREKAQGSFGRPHIAKVLAEHYPEEFGSISEVFGKLLEQGKPAFLSRTAHFCLDEAIDLIHEAGGLAILAHPITYRYDLHRLLHDFKHLGGDGMETMYDYARNYAHKGYTERDNEESHTNLHLLAEELGLLESGGSDFHGPNKGPELGTFGPQDEVLARLKKGLEERRTGKPL